MKRLIKIWFKTISIRCVNSILQSFICALEFLISALSFTLTKKFSNRFEIKFQLKGADIMCIVVTLIGILGMVPTGAAGCRSRTLKGKRGFEVRQI